MIFYRRILNLYWILNESDEYESHDQNYAHQSQ